MDETSSPTLILGRMPEDADEDTVIAAGPWCFGGLEHIFPDFVDRFRFAPEPMKDRELNRRAVDETRALAAAILPRLAERLAPAGCTLPKVYWETLLMPWLALIAEQIVERWHRVKALIESYGETILKIPVLPPDCHFRFKTEQEVMLHGVLASDVNHWLFSWLLRAAELPEKWSLIDLPAISKNCAPKKRPSLLSRIRNLAAQCFLTLPFPHLKGVSLSQSLRFSLALLHRSHGPDRSYSITEEASAEALSSLALPTDVLPVFLAFLPDCLKELKHPKMIYPTSAPRLRLASIRAYEDSGYRQKLALWRARGHRLMYIQHGGNYGQISFACRTAMVEYCQHCFGTWGWTKQGMEKGNFVPLPYPQLARIRNRARPRSHLLFVGTEMPLYGYRLDAHPTPLEMVAYREAKALFCAALDRDLLKSCLYRPYFPVPSTLSDGPWLLSRFPELSLCTGPLQDTVLNSRLLVLDHHGTTLLEAMAANVPLQLFWDREAWPLTAEAESMLDEMAHLGIWHPSAKEAAVACNRVWQDPVSWWQQSEIQNLRRKFIQCYALCSDKDETEVIISILSTL